VRTFFADPIRSGLEQVGEKIEIVHVGVIGAPTRTAVKDDPHAPAVRCCVLDAAGHPTDERPSRASP